MNDKQMKQFENINEYNNNDIMFTSASTEDTKLGVNWKTKKDYVNQMNWLNKILYYLWIIVLYKKLPIQQTGHLMNEEPVLQTLQSSTYTSYWHWNWWNPLTYIIAILFIVFMFFMNIIISIIQTLKMTNIVNVSINDENEIKNDS